MAQIFLGDVVNYLWKTMTPSLAEIAKNFDTDRTQSPDYIQNFERHFGHLRCMPVKILELGVYHGGGLHMWHQYFPYGLVVGLDRRPNPIPKMPERMRFYRGAQDDCNLLRQIATECAPDGFDIVIDDASHIGTVARSSFRSLFPNYLKSGGIYVVEDWGTGYWQSWPDGTSYSMSSGRFTKTQKPSLLTRVSKRLGWQGRDKTDPNFSSHNFGMVGFVKELVDEVAWANITAPNRGNADLPQHGPTIREMTIYAGQAFIVKA